MTTTRLEAFSDAVIAIVITIMVLELKVPEGFTFSAVKPILPIFLAYVLSFVFLAIYWNNHHHLLQTAERVTGRILWSNMHLLFWLSLTPVVTAWMGRNYKEVAPTVLYGVLLFMAAIAYYTLQQAIIASQGSDSLLRRAIGTDWKGKASPIIYAIGIASAFWTHWIAQACYVLVALIWLIPDRRIERVLGNR
jgi:uncharacterized membrane protein